PPMSQGSSEESRPGMVSPAVSTVRGVDAPSTSRATDPCLAIDGGGTVDLNPDEVVTAIRRSMFDSSLPSRPPLLPEGYQLAGKLGEGTYGEVWKGYHARTGIKVAIKFLRARESAQLQSLSDEAKKLALLHSDPHVVRLIDLEEKTTPPYFVMDFAEHGS